MSNAPIKWKAQSYEPTAKTADWYWGLGILTFVAVFFAYRFDNTIFAVLIVSISAAVVLASRESHPNGEHAITSKGVETNGHTYQFENIKSFYVFEDPINQKHKLLLNTKDTFLNHVSIPLGSVDMGHVRDVMRRHVLEKKQTPSLVDACMEWLKI
jgi:hypothetical protein